MSELLNDLNEEQIQAVTHVDGPLMIVAGAGTGKTTVITRRIAWLIEQGHCKPEQILALTFTEKAAAEMEERVDVLLPYGYIDLQISTFHAFCEKLLRDYGTEIGLSRDFKLVTELDAWLLTRNQFDRFVLDYYRPMGNPTKFLRSFLKHFSRAKDAGIHAERYLEFVEGKWTDQDLLSSDEETVEEAKQIKELAQAYQTYQAILLEQDSLDFGDLILYSRKLLMERPRVLKLVQEKYRYILVDEFQDTNQAQYDLITLITGFEHPNLTIVGDDDQAIYKFRGASLANILRFGDDFPTAKKVVLNKNYRSGQTILDQAHQFIQANNPNRLEAQDATLSKRLLSQRDIPGNVTHLHGTTLEDEVKQVVEKILLLKEKDESINWEDFAILVRSNAAGEDFATALEQHGIPYQFLALSGLYTKPVILNCLAMLRVIDQPHDSPNMYRVLAMPLWQLHSMTIIELSQLARQKGKSLFEAAQLARTLPQIDSTDLDRIDQLLTFLNKIRLEANRRRISELFIKVVRESGYVEFLNNLEEQQKLEDFKFLQQLLDRMKSFESRSDHQVLHSFLEEFDHEREAGEEGSLSVDMDSGPDVVKIMTVHAAKGLEFRYVFVVNLIDRKFPTQRRTDAIPLSSELDPQAEQDADGHLEEERRLFYVAMTRAKEGLYFTSADDYGGIRTRKLSRFLDELGYQKPNSTKLFEVDLLDEDTVDTRSTTVNPYQLPKQFSFTQLAAFRTCPLQYKFAHILGVPVYGKWTFSFGKTMHNTLQRFFELWIERAGDAQVIPTPPVSMDELMDLYQANWQDDWFEDDKQRDEYREKGREQLRAYYRLLEQDQPSPAFLEVGFTIKFGPIVLKGRIDRIDSVEGGVEIIDYKTGTPKKAEKMDREDKEQLYLYQIAAKEALGLEPKKLTFHYLEDNSEVSFIGTEKDLDKLRESIEERVLAIRDSAFEATPSFLCRYCDFADICEFRES